MFQIHLIQKHTMSQITNTFVRHENNNNMSVDVFTDANYEK